MKIACVQMNVIPGQCESNFIYMKQQILLAKQQQADMIVFPQNAVSGYLLGDMWLDDEWCRYVDHFNARITELADTIAIVWGNIRYRHKMRFNCAFFAYQSKTRMCVKKNQDTYYFQDTRYFTENKIHAVIEFKDRIIALNFGQEIQPADLNIQLDCKPWIIDELHLAKGTCIYVNTMGVQNIGKNIGVFDGQCRIVKAGELIASGNAFETGIVWSDLHQVASKPKLLDVLLYGIKGFDTQSLGGKLPWIVGLSGGLDSSISATLLTMALGKKRVYGYNMATRYNSELTKSNASLLADALGIPLKEGNIEELVTSSIHTVTTQYGYDASTWDSLVVENMQARLRGHLLASFASIHGGVIVNNGNKVEAALGYCTLYGDAIGALCVIGDLTKVQLFDLAIDMNDRLGKEVIPLRLLPVVQDEGVTWEMPPSAELKENQLDPMKWFYHDYLIKHLHDDLSITKWMQMYLDGTAFQTAAGRWLMYYGLDDPQAFIEDIEWLVNTMNRNGFKRIQLPPILCVSKNPYGNAFVETQTSFEQVAYQQLKLAISKKGQ